jgi:hypothetical protein
MKRWNRRKVGRAVIGNPPEKPRLKTLSRYKMISIEIRENACPRNDKQVKEFKKPKSFVNFRQTVHAFHGRRADIAK